MEAYERRDYPAAARELLPLAQQGDARAQNNSGGMHAEGRGVARDEAEAIRWYRKAAEQGDATAQSSLASMYEQGRGVAQDSAMPRSGVGTSVPRQAFPLGYIATAQCRLASGWPRSPLALANTLTAPASNDVLPTAPSGQSPVPESGRQQG
jgi:TPR repeat protein